MPIVEMERNPISDENHTKPSWIPEISDDRLAELGARIKPVIRFSRVGKKLFRKELASPYYIEEVDPRKIAYTWEPAPTTKAKGLTVLTCIRTFHTYGFYGFFKPSIAEVLAQIPEALIENVVAFEILKAPKTVEDLNRESKALDAGYHVALTCLYTRRKI